MEVVAEYAPEEYTVNVYPKSVFEFGDCKFWKIYVLLRLYTQNLAVENRKGTPNQIENLIHKLTRK